MHPHTATPTPWVRETGTTCTGSNDPLQLERTALVLQQVVAEAAGTCAAMFRSRRQHLSLAMDSAPARLRGDAVRWAQVVTHLLHNASRFTPPGGYVEIALRVDADARTAELRVVDNGCGMTPGELEAIFQRSCTRPGDATRLALMRRLVELHGGSLRARSAGPNLGATFLARVPLLPDAAPEDPAPIRFSRP